MLSRGLDYLPLARELSTVFEVHLMERRRRPGSGAQRAGHSIDIECADLSAMASATGAAAVFGHSFGGLVALETACRSALFDEVSVDEAGVPLRGQLDSGWAEEYQRRLDRGDRRGAFAAMVRSAGFAPRVLQLMPLGYVRFVLGQAIPHFTEAILPGLDHPAAMEEPAEIAAALTRHHRRDAGEQR